MLTTFSGCPSLGFSTAFSIRPPYKFPARVSDARSFCFSPCSSSYSDASSALAGRCPSCLGSQCFSSTSVLSSLRSPSNTAGLSVDSSYSCKKQSTKFMLNQKTIRGNYAGADRWVSVLHLSSSISNDIPVHGSLTNVVVSLHHIMIELNK